jgi:hypothetical protein
LNTHVRQKVRNRNDMSSDTSRARSRNRSSSSSSSNQNSVNKRKTKLRQNDVNNLTNGVTITAGNDELVVGAEKCNTSAYG